MSARTTMLAVVRPAPWSDDESARPELSVVIPAYNEQQRLPAVLASLEDHVDAATTEVIVVDDGSTDGTVRMAKRHGSWSPRLRILEHGHNRGKGAAVRTGVLAARGRLVAFVDADNATDLSALAPMCAAIRGDVGAVFGSRHAPGSQVTGSPPVRGVMGRVFNHVVRWAAGTTISDTQCGAKVFWAPAARAVFADVEIDGFAFDVELIGRFQQLGIEIVEHPVSWHYMAGTKIRLLTPLQMLVDIARLRLRPAARVEPSFTANVVPGIEAVVDPLSSHDEFKFGAELGIVVPRDGATHDDVRRRLAALGAITES